MIRRIKRPGDIWFHAKNVRGAHVLLRTPNRSELTADVLLWAARIAAQRSGGRLAGKVEVDYTDAANVKKPGGSPPGFVTYKGAKTIIVEM
jgi:predicted ribosome quality control (RQC) complex YloA/Tae2 family protein